MGIVRSRSKLLAKVTEERQRKRSSSLRNNATVNASYTLKMSSEKLFIRLIVLSPPRSRWPAQRQHWPVHDIRREALPLSRIAQRACRRCRFLYKRDSRSACIFPDRLAPLLLSLYRGNP